MTSFKEKNLLIHPFIILWGSENEIKTSKRLEAHVKITGLPYDKNIFMIKNVSRLKN